MNYSDIIWWDMLRWSYFDGIILIAKRVIFMPINHDLTGSQKSQRYRWAATPKTVGVDVNYFTTEQYHKFLEIGLTYKFSSFNDTPYYQNI